MRISWQSIGIGILFAGPVADFNAFNSWPVDSGPPSCMLSIQVWSTKSSLHCSMICVHSYVVSIQVGSKVGECPDQGQSLKFSDSIPSLCSWLKTAQSHQMLASVSRTKSLLKSGYLRIGWDTSFSFNNWNASWQAVLQTNLIPFLVRRCRGWAIDANSSINLQ